MTAIKRWGIPGVLFLCLAALLVTSYVSYQGRGPKTDPGMLVTARQQARNFFTLDYRHPDADVDRVLALATGTFKKEYADRRDEVEAGVRKKKLIVTAAIPADGVAVELVDGDRGQVIAAVDVTTGSADGAQPTQNRYRTRLILTKVDGRWLVSGLEQVG